jgi:hypothetical protein
MSTSSIGSSETLADQPWYRVVVPGFASWVGSSTFQATGLLSSGVMAAAIVVFVAWRRLGSKRMPVRSRRRAASDLSTSS